MAALAKVLNKNYAGATATLKDVKKADGLTDYLLAIVNARQGNNSAAATALQNAIRKNPSLTSYAANDLEFSKVNR